MPFLRTGQGAIAAAVGEAYTARADDATAMFWNPAGLGQIDEYHLALTHHQWFGDTKDELLHAVFPSNLGAVGLSFAYSGVSGIESWSRENESTGTFGTWDGVVSLGYGLPLGRRFGLGAALKGFYEDLSASQGYGGALDLGFMARPLPALRLGLSGRNLGIGTGYGSDVEYLPSELAAGACLAVSKLTASCDVVMPLDNDVSVRLGAQYEPVRGVAVRLGYRTGPVDVSSLGFFSGLTAGIGVEAGPLRLDYSVSPVGRLGVVQRLGLATHIARRGSGSVRIRVFDAITMRPLDARVTITGVKKTSIELGRTGEVFLRGLVPGQLIIRTGRNGYAARADTLQILGDREQSATITLTEQHYGGIVGGIYDAVTRKPIAGFIDYRGPVQGGASADPTLGSYAIKGTLIGRYAVTASGPDPSYAPQTCTLDVNEGRVTPRDFFLTRRAAPPRTQPRTPPATAPQPLPATAAELPSIIPFAPGSATLGAEAVGRLSQVVSAMVADSTITLEVAGHADPLEATGTSYESAWELSRARAEAVRDYLIQNGTALERLSPNGYGDTQPLAPNDTDAERQQNRRVELRITAP